MGSDVVVIARAAGVMVSESVAVWVSASALASVTLNVKDVAVTVTVGVPIIAPVAAFKLRPAGREPDVSDHV